MKGPIARQLSMSVSLELPWCCSKFPAPGIAVQRACELSFQCSCKKLLLVWEFGCRVDAHMHQSPASADLDILL